MDQKEEVAFPFPLHNQITLSKKASPAANTKKKMIEDKYLTLVSMVTVKSIFLKIEDLLCVLKLVSLWTLYEIIGFF